MIRVSSDYSEIVKSMERGQVTIPIKIREKLGIGPRTWLWVKLVGNKILIEPVKTNRKGKQFLSALKSIASDSKSYWGKRDDQVLKKIRKKLCKDLKSFPDETSFGRYQCHH